MLKEKQMTIHEIRGLTDWDRTLQSQSVWATLFDGRTLRVICVGVKWVWVSSQGQRVQVDPCEIKEIKGIG